MTVLNTDSARPVYGRSDHAASWLERGSLLERASFYGLFLSLVAALVTSVPLIGKIYPFDIFLLLLFSSWGLRLIAGSRRGVGAPRLKPVSTDLVLVLLLLVTYVTSVFGLNYANSKNSFLLLARGSLVYLYMRVNFGSAVRARDWQRIVAILLAVEIAVCLLQSATQSFVGAINNYFGAATWEVRSAFQAREGSIIRAVGTFQSPVIPSDWFVLLSPLLYSLYSFKTVRRPINYLVLWLLSQVALITTFARAAWAGMLVALFVLNRLLAGTRSGRKIGQNALLRLSLLFILAAMLLLVGLLQAEIFVENPIAERLGVVDPTGRLVYMDIAMQIIQRQPLSGIGLGNFREALFGPAGDTLEIPLWFYQRTQGTGVHNIYLLFAAESGILGGILFFMFVLGVALKLWKAISLHRDRDLETTALVVGLLAGWAGFAISMLFELGFTHPSVQILFFAIAGTATASSLMNAQETTSDHV